MDQAHAQRLSAALLVQQDTLAELWHGAIAETSFVPLSRAEVQRRLGELVGEVIAWLVEDGPASGRPHQVGARLAGLHFLQSEALERSLLFLGETFSQNLPAGLQHHVLQRMPLLLAGVATGFHARSQEMVFAEQEWVRLALLDAQVRAHQAAEETEARFRLLVEQAADAIYLYDLDGTILDFNQRALDWLGYTRDELTGMHVGDVDPTMAKDAIVERLHQFPTGIPSTLETEHRRKDGTVFPVEVSFGMFHWGDQPLVLSIARDISVRRRAEAALAESESKFRTLAESTNAAIFMYRRDRNIYVNAAALRITGYAMDELVAMPFWTLIREDYQELVRGRGMARLHGQLVLPRYEVPIVQKSGQLRWVEFSGSLIDFEGQPTVLGTAFDVTERRLAVDRLQQVARQLEVLSDIDRAALAGEPIEAVAARGLALGLELVSAHRGSVTVLDPTTDDATILVTQSLIGPDQLPGTRHRMPRGAVAILRQGKVCYVADIQSRPARMPIEDILEQIGVRSYVNVPLSVQGELIGSLNLSSTQPDAFGDGAGIILREVADRLALAIYNARLFGEVETSRQRLQQLSRRLVEVQEQERHNIARELHDEIGQTLTGLKLTLETVARQPAGAAGDSLRGALQMVDELVVRARQMSIELRPPMLDDLGLLHTLLWHFERYTAQTRIAVDFEHRSLERRYAPELEMACYRIVQEALTNVARHARVDRVKVRLWSGEGMLNIQVEDGGDGFDYATVSHLSKSIGLMGMAERAQLLGGQFGVETAPAAGTCITVAFPLGNGGGS